MKKKDIEKFITERLEKLKNDPIHKKWCTINDKAVNNYSLLSDNERVCFSLRLLIDAVSNGGIVGFYCNHSGEKMSEVLYDLEVAGCFDVVKRLAELNGFFPNSIVPKDINERNKCMEMWNKKQDEALENFDEWFYSISDKLEEKYKELILAEIH